MRWLEPYRRSMTLDKGALSTGRLCQWEQSALMNESRAHVGVFVMKENPTRRSDQRRWVPGWFFRAEGVGIATWIKHFVRQWGLLVVFQTFHVPTPPKLPRQTMIYCRLTSCLRFPALCPTAYVSPGLGLWLRLLRLLQSSPCTVPLQPAEPGLRPSDPTVKS